MTKLFATVRQVTSASADRRQPQQPTAEAKTILRSESDVSDRQLGEGLTTVLILVEREGDVERRPVIGEVVVAFGGPPRDGAEDPAILPQRQFEVALFQLARPVDDL